jgi:hypothetical protein
MSRFRTLVLAQMTYWRLVRPYPVPRFALSTPPAILCSPLLFSRRTSCLKARCLLRNRDVPSLPVSFDFFCPLPSHIISLIYRHLALYHSQVAISEFESFELLPTFKI